MESGAAYVFVRNGTTWSQQAYLKASNSERLDFFGWSVAVSGNTVVVGAVNERSDATGVDGSGNDNSALDAGAAYVFVRNGETWSQQAYLKASNTERFDRFGWSVAVSGDTAVVGAPNEASIATGVDGNQINNSAVNSGAVYVFVRSGTTWSQQAYLKASNTEAFDSFSYSVSVSGDTVVVGAVGESSNAAGVNGNQNNNSAPASGAAYVFVRGGANWTQQAYLKASNPGGGNISTGTAGNNFGISVSVSGNTVVAGAYEESSNATGVNGIKSNISAFASGAAYVFVRDRTIWNQLSYLKASNTGEGDHFGRAVSVAGDTVVVGAHQESSNATGVNGDQSNNSGPNTGAAFVFTGLGSRIPRIAVELSTGTVRIYWPLPATDFLLDEADDLSASPVTGWTQVQFPYQTNATEISITVPQSVGNKFYRLRKP